MPDPDLNALVRVDSYLYSILNPIFKGQIRCEFEDALRIKASMNTVGKEDRGADRALSVDKGCRCLGADFNENNRWRLPLRPLNLT